MHCASGAGGNGLIDRTPLAEMTSTSPGLNVALVSRADEIHRARLRADDPTPRRGVRARSGRKPCGSRTAIRRSLVAITERRRLALRHRLDDRVLDAARLRARVEVQDDFGVAVDWKIEPC
jgi:hypothetical protein